MPIRDTNGMLELCAIAADGAIMHIGKISNVEVVSEPEYDGPSSYLTMPSKECTFSVTWNYDLKMLHLLIRGRFPTNNWCRMHGMRAVRKDRRKKGESK